MAGINVGTLEAVLKLKDEMTPAIHLAGEVTVKDSSAIASALSTVTASSNLVTDAEGRREFRMNAMHAAAMQMNNDLAGLNDKALIMSKNIELANQTITAMGKASGITAETVKSLSGFGGDAAIALGNSLGPAAAIASVGLGTLKNQAAGFNATSLNLAGAAFSVGSAIGSWIASFPAVAKAVDGVASSVMRLFTSTAELNQQALGQMSQAEFQRQIAEKQVGVLEQHFQGFKKLGVASEEYKTFVEGLTTAQKRQLGIAGEQIAANKLTEAAAEKAAEKVKQHAEAVKQLSDQFSGSAIVAKINLFNEALAKTGPTPNAVIAARALAEEATKAGVKIETGLVGALQRLNATPPPTASIEGGKKLATTLDWAKNNVVALKIAAKENAQVLEDDLKDALDDAAIAAQKLANDTFLAEKAQEEFRKEMQEAADMAGSLGGAIDAAGELFVMFGGDMDSAAGKAITALSGLAATAQNVFGALARGDMLGAVIAGVTGIARVIKGLFTNAAKAAQKEANKLKDSFIEMSGGLDVLKLKAEAAGVSLDAFMAAKNADQAKKAIADINAALGLHDESIEKTRAAMEKYGLTVEQMGPKWQAQELNAKALSLLEEYRLLTAAGADHNLVIEKMGPSLVEYANQARNTGTAIPEAMRGVIETLIAQGQLLDANGNAFGSAEEAGITFAQTLEVGIQKTIEAIDRLVAALTGIPNTERTVTVTTQHREASPPPGPRPDGPEPPEFAHGSGGFRDFGAGTTAVLHGREAVVTPSQFKGITGGADRPVIARLAPEDIALLAKATRDAVMIGR